MVPSSARQGPPSEVTGVDSLPSPSPLLASLPREILTHIASHLGLTSRAHLSRTSKFFAAIIHDETAVSDADLVSFLGGSTDDEFAKWVDLVLACADDVEGARKVGARFLAGAPGLDVEVALNPATMGRPDPPAAGVDDSTSNRETWATHLLALFKQEKLLADDMFDLLVPAMAVMHFCFCGYGFPGPGGKARVSYFGEKVLERVYVWDASRFPLWVPETLKEWKRGMSTKGLWPEHFSTLCPIIAMERKYCGQDAYGLVAQGGKIEDDEDNEDIASDEYEDFDEEQSEGDEEAQHEELLQETMHTALEALDIYEMESQKLQFLQRNGAYDMVKGFLLMKPHLAREHGAEFLIEIKESGGNGEKTRRARRARLTKGHGLTSKMKKARRLKVQGTAEKTRRDVEDEEEGEDEEDDERWSSSSWGGSDVDWETMDRTDNEEKGKQEA